MLRVLSILALLPLSVVQGLDNGLALTPPSKNPFTIIELLSDFHLQWDGWRGKDLPAILTAPMTPTTASGVNYVLKWSELFFS